METVVQIESLIKTFGDTKAVDGISLTIQRGEIFGLLGPNGAGKTTTLEMLEGLRTPTQGHISVLGLDMPDRSSEIKERIGVQLQSSAYFDFLTLREILKLFGNFYRRHVDAEHLLDLVSLSDKVDTLLKKLSGGQKQRFTVAASLVNDPDLIILDEPTAGLDPIARKSIWDLIRAIHTPEKTILITTHYMEEAEELCNRVAIMDQGKILAVDSVPNLIRLLDDNYRVFIQTSAPLDLGSDLPMIKPDYGPNGFTISLHVQDPVTIVPLVIDIAKQQQVSIEHLTITSPTLEDVFLNLTGRLLTS